MWQMLFKVMKGTLLFTSLVISASDSDSLDRSPANADGSVYSTFDWESMIDWSYSPGRIGNNIESRRSDSGTTLPAQQEPSGKNSIIKEEQISSLRKIRKRKRLVEVKRKPTNFTSATRFVNPPQPVQKPKKKNKTNKERYSAEKLRQYSKNYYDNYRKDPERVKRVQDNKRARYLRRKAEKEELLARLPEADRQAEIAKKDEELAKRRFKYRLKQNPNAVNEPRTYKLSEEQRRQSRERGAKYRLKRKLEARKNTFQNEQS